MCQSCDIRKRFGRYRAIHQEEEEIVRRYDVIQYNPTYSRTVHTEREMYDECIFIPVQAAIYFTPALLPFSCPVCFENKTRPVLMMCGHCICVKCYNTLICRYNQLNIACPVCRTISQYDITVNGTYCHNVADYHPFSP